MKSHFKGHTPNGIVEKTGAEEFGALTQDPRGGEMLKREL